MIEIYAFRHTQSRHNENGLIRGQAHSLLSEEGKQQAEDIADALQNIPFTAFFTSDTDICSRFTWEVMKKQKQSGISIMPFTELRDRCLGVYEGQSYSTISAIGTIDAAFQMAISKEEIEEGESLTSLNARLQEFFKIVKGFERRGYNQQSQEILFVASHAVCVAHFPALFSGKQFKPEECRLLGHGEYHYFRLEDGILKSEKDMRLYQSIDSLAEARSAGK